MERFAVYEIVKPIISIFFIFSMIHQMACGQHLTVDLIATGKPFEQTAYKITEVIDMRVNKNQIGEVFQINDKKGNVLFKNSLDQSALDFYTKNVKPYQQEVQKIQARIFEFTLTESKASGNNVYNGDIQLIIGFFKLGNFEPVHLVDYSGSVQYRRSANRLEMIESLVNRIFRNGLEYFDTWIKMQVMDNKHLVQGVRLKIIDKPKWSDKDTVYYSTERPLIWDDFRDRPNSRSRFNASIFTSFSIQGKSLVESGTIVQTIEIDVYMLPDQSWVRNPSDYALNHEQRHFDVVRIVADRLVYQLRNLTLDPDWYEATINDAYLNAYREMNRLQEIYDKQTRHGMDTVEQERWNHMLDQALKGNWEEIDRELNIKYPA
ncbi:DUF922 domain-containing protein [Cecembia calidifontis]|uniref:Uncharacterized protein n=1 Tax=Cecembia calidifontis TaxID=1187080 RepID=A0A4Q7PDA4_9BACT|nr:hypothetical protein [Cecembia calidifontis]RZS97590.1 hypothetical protein BC751_3205 [Cecembia calidifontis]